MLNLDFRNCTALVLHFVSIDMDLPLLHYHCLLQLLVSSLAALASIYFECFDIFYYSQLIQKCTSSRAVPWIPLGVSNTGRPAVEDRVYMKDPNFQRQVRARLPLSSKNSAKDIVILALPAFLEIVRSVY